jgi:FkbM family methyltransferase
MYDVPAEIPVETIVDLGANIGFASRWLFCKFRGARLVAVEPDPFNATFLRANLANVPGSTVVEACIAARDQEVYLQLGTQADNHVMVHRPSEKSLAVPGISMLSLMRRCGLERIDLLKVDIEGAEAELLGETAEQWIGRVGCAVIELHDELPIDELKRRLAPHGFEVLPSRDFEVNHVAVCLNKRRRPDWGISASAGLPE